MYLFANAEATSFFPPEFLPAIVMSVIYLLLAVVLFMGLWKFIDWLTPGDLDKELLGTPEQRVVESGIERVIPGKAPNLALAVVVAALVVGFCLILTAAIK
jgi:hypothetical protein